MTPYNTTLLSTYLFFEYISFPYCNLPTHIDSIHLSLLVSIMLFIGKCSLTN